MKLKAPHVIGSVWLALAAVAVVIPPTCLQRLAGPSSPPEGRLSQAAHAPTTLLLLSPPGVGTAGLRGSFSARASGALDLRHLASQMTAADSRDEAKSPSTVGQGAGSRGEASRLRPREAAGVVVTLAEKGHDPATCPSKRRAAAEPSETVETETSMEVPPASALVTGDLPRALAPTRFCTSSKVATFFQERVVIQWRASVATIEVADASEVSATAAIEADGPMAPGRIEVTIVRRPWSAPAPPAPPAPVPDAPAPLPAG